MDDCPPTACREELCRTGYGYTDERSEKQDSRQQQHQQTHRNSLKNIKHPNNQRTQQTTNPPKGPNHQHAQKHRYVAVEWSGSWL
jgi:hypothetical protein